MLRQRGTHCAHVLRRRDHEHDIARCHGGEVSGGLQPRVENDAWQERCVGPACDYFSDDIGLACPDQRVPAGATHGLREGCAPRATSHNPDAAERHRNDLRDPLSSLPEYTRTAAASTRPPPWQYRVHRK
jgi:hypothetical protein